MRYDKNFVEYRPFKGRVHDIKALELRPEIFRMWVFSGVVSDYDTVESLKSP